MTFSRLIYLGAFINYVTGVRGGAYLKEKTKSVNWWKMTSFRWVHETTQFKRVICYVTSETVYFQKNVWNNRKADIIQKIWLRPNSHGSDFHIETNKPLPGLNQSWVAKFKQKEFREKLSRNKWAPYLHYMLNETCATFVLV